MPTIQQIQHRIKDASELNLSFITFVVGGGFFIPTKDHYELGDKVQVELFLEPQNLKIAFEGKVIWITPLNALHHISPGIGVQFTGTSALQVRAQIEAHLSRDLDVGGYTSGFLK